MLNGEINENTITEYENFAANSAMMSSDNEIKAVHAERDIDDLYKSVYMRDRIGEEYEAVICSVTSFGFFAKTENLCEGLVSIDSLGGGFYYDKDNYTLSRGRTVYRLGQRVKIRVEDVDVSSRQVNFYLIKNNKENNNEENKDENKVYINRSRSRNGYERKPKSSKILVNCKSIFLGLVCFDIYAEIIYFKPSI
jgi:ribonuclease R